MADDIKLKWGSTGFEKVRQEMKEMESVGATSGSWFKSMQTTMSETGEAGVSFSQKLSNALSSIAPMAGAAASVILQIGTAIATVAGVATGVGVAAFTAWTSSVLKTTESFELLEISLYGATKSWEAVAGVSKFAKEYAAEYPAMYKDVMQVMQSMAYMPSMKPMLQRGDVKEMKEMMDVIQGLMTMRPDQGTQGAMYALREALTGNWRSLQMRFDVPIASIARSAGMTMEQMKENPEAAIKALKAFTNEFVGAETMAMMAKNLGTQMGNLKDKYQMWMDTLGKTGIYQKVVGYIIELNDVFDKVMKSEKFKEFTVQLNAVMEGIAEKFAGMFTEGIDWSKVEDLTTLVTALGQVANNVAAAIKDAWGALKEPLFATLEVVFVFIKEKLLNTVTDIFVPVGIAIGKAIVSGVSSQLARLLDIPGARQFAPGLVESLELIGGVTARSKVDLGPRPEAGTAAAGIYSLKEAAMANQTSPELAAALDRTTKGWSAFADRFTAFVKELGGPKKEDEGKSLGGGGADPTQLEKEMEAREKLADVERKGQWSYYQQWSRMGSMMAEAPEQNYKSMNTPWERYLGGKIDWDTMKKQDKVADFQKTQESKLEEMVGTERGREKPSLAFMGQAYGELFNLSYKRGDFGKAQEYKDKTLETMKEDMEKQRQLAEKSATSLGNIDVNTANTIIELKRLVPGGRPTTYMPALPAPGIGDDTREGVRGENSYTNL